ncbi:MAG: hypothetical protein WCZ72_10110 [Gemmobacter sp.]
MANGAGDEGRWPLWKLGVMFYPFAAPAVAINLFMLMLLAQVLGLPAISPYTALTASVLLGMPAAWAAARWARSLLDEAAE